MASGSELQEEFEELIHPATKHSYAYIRREDLKRWKKEHPNDGPPITERVFGTGLQPIRLSQRRTDTENSC